MITTTSSKKQAGKYSGVWLGWFIKESFTFVSIIRKNMGVDKTPGLMRKASGSWEEFPASQLCEGGRWTIIVTQVTGSRMPS